MIFTKRAQKLITSKRYTGFTLAEVLITLAVIGVVASISIPSMMQNNQEASWKASWKKAYATLYQAYQEILYEKGGTIADYYIPGSSAGAAPLVSDFASKLNTIKECLPDPADSYSYPRVCGDTSTYLIDIKYKTLDGDTLYYPNIHHGQLVLNNGMHLFFRIWYSTGSLIFVDVNGYQKGPNTLGKDTYGVVITKDSMKPLGAEGTINDDCSGAPLTCINGAIGFHTTPCSGVGCSAKYLIGD